MKQILIAGGTGFLGQVLTRHFHRKGWQVTILTRQLNAQNLTLKTQHPLYRLTHWDGKTLGPWTSEIEQADVLINLCGKSVNCRYHKRNKRQILTSRIEPTNVLAKAIHQAKNPPAVWLNASSSTIYAHSLETPMTERDGKLGEGFSVEICKAWEKAFFALDLPHTRRVALRSSMALGHASNSVYPILKRITRLGMGGRMSTGNQMVSWIHQEDFARAVEFAIQNETIEGTLNLTAPAPVTNATFMKSFRKALHVPFGLAHYKPLLEIAAWFMRTETELTLKSRYIHPTKLLKNRFVFKYPFIDEALENLTQSKQAFDLQPIPQQ